jgi:reverse transcriptase-like protein
MHPVQNHRCRINPFIAIYVDDTLVAAKGQDAVAEIKNMLAQEYMVTDLGVVERYLDIEIEQDPNSKFILLHQSAYFQQLPGA